MRMKLTIQLSGKVLERREFESIRRLLVGRAQGCDLVIDNVGVSRNHFEIVPQGEVCMLRDLGSNNGTFVNGRRVWSHNLNSGDEIAFGKFKALFEVAPPPAHLPEKVAEKPDGDFTMAIDARRSDARLATNRVKGHVVVAENGREASAVPLEKNIFVIGKGRGVDLLVPGFFVARKHAIIVRDEAGFVLVDATGRGRTFLNDSVVEIERLHDGDVIRIGSRKLRFHVGSPAY